MSLLLLYLESQGTDVLNLHLTPCCHIFLPYSMSCDIERIQTTCLHASRCHYCHYCNFDFVLFQNFTHYTNSLLSHIHVNIGYPLNIMCTLVATCMILRRLTLCYSIMSHATLILFYHTCMLTQHNSLILCALWLPQSVFYKV
jgi:hypothetical protein